MLIKEFTDESKKETVPIQNQENQVSYAPRVFGQSARESFTDYSNPRAKEIAVYPGQSIQKAIDIIHALDGGTILLKTGTHLPNSNIMVYSNVAIRGDAVGETIVDFQGTSNHFIIQGTDPYTVGSASVTISGTTVTGSGTTNWTQAMIGQSILLQEFWYEISNVTSTASITLVSQYIGDSLTGDTYVIATTVNSVNLYGIVVQNSTSSGVKAQYYNSLSFDTMAIFNCDTGFDLDDASFNNIYNTIIDSCTNGMTADNTMYSTFFNSNITNITNVGFAANRIRDWGLEVFAFTGIGGTAITLRNSVNNGFVDFSIQHVGGAGIELIAGNSDMGFSDGVINNAVGDGVRLVDNNDRNSFIGNSFINNGGWGIEIVDATNQDNIVYPNTYNNNTSGNLSDSGTRSITGSALSKLRTHKSNAQNIDTSITKVQFDVIDYNPSGEYDNVTNYRFTATVAGYYLVNTRFYQHINNGDTVTGYLYKNGSAVSRNVQTNATGVVSDTPVNVTDIIALSVGDYIEIFGKNTQGSVAVGTDSTLCFLNIHFLSNL